MSRASSELGEQGEAAVAIDQDVQGLLVGTEERVGFPVSQFSALVGGQGAGIDENTVGSRANLNAAALASAALLLAPAQVLIELLPRPGPPGLGCWPKGES